MEPEKGKKYCKATPKGNKIDGEVDQRSYRPDVKLIAARG